MQILRWDERFSVGNQTIDFQHKKLFDLVNYLTIGSGEAYEEKVMEGLLEELIAYTDYHFSSEETILIKRKHSDYEIHCKMHAGFVEKVLLFQEEFKKGNEQINGEVFAYLVKWIQNHILKMDVPNFSRNSSYPK